MAVRLNESCLPIVVMGQQAEELNHRLPTRFIQKELVHQQCGAGLLVGFGSVWGNGCTSGHGVCGLSRLSVRSLVATLTFMATAMATVFVTRHVF